MSFLTLTDKYIVQYPWQIPGIKDCINIYHLFSYIYEYTYIYNETDLSVDDYIYIYIYIYIYTTV